jgi:hypothetical protein
MVDRVRNVRGGHMHVPVLVHERMSISVCIRHYLLRLCAMRMRAHEAYMRHGLYSTGHAAHVLADDAGLVYPVQHWVCVCIRTSVSLAPSVERQVMLYLFRECAGRTYIYK